MKLVIICLILLIFPKAIYSQEGYDLKLENQISLDLTQLIIESPRKIETGAGVFLWMAENSITAFDSTGYLYTYDKKGRGPGEFEYLTNIEVRHDTLYIYDNSLKKIMVFKITDKGLEYLSEEVFNSPNSRNFAINGGKEVYFLHSDAMIDDMPAVSQFNFSGTISYKFGRQPALAALNRGLGGGGITESSDGKDIYYSYLGDMILYKKTKDKQVIELKDVPDYFTMIESSEVKKIRNNLSELIFKAYEVSRVINVFEHQNLIVRIIEDGGPRMEGPTKYYLEIWENDRRVNSKIIIPGKYAVSDGNFIYTTSDYESNIITSVGKTDVLNKYLLIKQSEK